MSELETNIRNWRSALVARETLRAEDLDELEDHLRQEIDALSRLQRGEKPALSDAEAFALAKQRLGSTTELAAEFAKADPNAAWRRRWIWMLVGYIGLGSAATFISALSGAIAFRADSTLRGVLYAAATCVGLATVVLLARATARGRAAQFMQRVLGRRLRTARGIVVFTLLVMGVRAVLVPLYPRFLVSTGIGYSTTPASSFMVYASVAMWLAPFVALAIVLWLDRSRHANADESAADAR